MNKVQENNSIGDILVELLERAKVDPGAAFEPASLIFLRNLRTTNPAEWARLRPELKKTKTPITELERLTKPEPSKVGPKTFIAGWPEAEPWPEPVDGCELLDLLTATIRRYVVADLPTIQAAALWVLFTWFHRWFSVSPIAAITAPEKRCGKSVLLATLARLVFHPLVTSNISGAAVFRAVDKYSPCLLIDEVDSFLPDNEGLRGILNSGFERENAQVIRVEGDDHELTAFRTFAPKALCGIGHLSDTLADRSIPLKLRRKLPGEIVERLRRSNPTQWEILHRKIARFVSDHSASVESHIPQEVIGLNDRAQDAWEPLFVIAELAGGHWPETAHNISLELHNDEEEPNTVSTQLLADIQGIFHEHRQERFFTHELIDALVMDKEKRWATHNRGFPITPAQLAKLLKEYGIKSRSMRRDGINLKGYERADFKDAFSRYLTPYSSVQGGVAVTAEHPVKDAGLHDSASRHTDRNVTSEVNLDGLSQSGCDAVTASAPLQARKNIDELQSAPPAWTGLMPPFVHP